MSKKVNDEALKELARIYNARGKSAMYQAARDQYDIKQTSTLYRRMKSSVFLGYDEENDNFQLKAVDTGAVFMSMEELCAPTVMHQEGSVRSTADRSAAMEKLIHQLIGERLLELDRYVKIDQASRTVIIDNTSLRNDGYRVISH